MTTFPATSLLADFTTLPAGGPPPSASFSNTVGAGQGLIVDSGACVGVDNTLINSARWNTQFGPDCEAWITLGVVDALNDYYTLVALRCQNANSLNDCYRIIYSSLNGAIDLERIDNTGTGHVLGTQAQTMVIGDAIGLRVTGDNLDVFYKPVAGVWTRLFSAIDSNISTAGYIALGISADVNTILNLGGGGFTCNEGTITTQKVGQSLDDVVYTPVEYCGDKFLNSGAVIVMLKNNGASAVTVEATTQALIQGLHYNNPTVTVAAGDTGAMDNLGTAIFNDSYGYTHLTYSGADVLSLSIAVVER